MRAYYVSGDSEHGMWQGEYTESQKKAFEVARSRSLNSDQQVYVERIDLVPMTLPNVIAILNSHGGSCIAESVTIASFSHGRRVS